MCHCLSLQPLAFARRLLGAVFLSLLAGLGRLLLGGVAITSTSESESEGTRGRLLVLGPKGKLLTSLLSFVGRDCLVDGCGKLCGENTELLPLFGANSRVSFLPQQLLRSWQLGGLVR